MLWLQYKMGYVYKIHDIMVKQQSISKVPNLCSSVFVVECAKCIDFVLKNRMETHVFRVHETADGFQRAEIVGLLVSLPSGWIPHPELITLSRQHITGRPLRDGIPEDQVRCLAEMKEIIHQQHSMFLLVALEHLKKLLGRG